MVSNYTHKQRIEKLEQQLVDVGSINLRLMEQLSTLRKAAKKSMKGCVRCRGKVKFRGKDLEVWVCNYCEDLTAALEEQGK